MKMSQPNNLILPTLLQKIAFGATSITVLYYDNLKSKG